MKCSLGISNFLEEISSLSHSVVFLYFFALIAEEGFLISSCYSLELCIQMLISSQAGIKIARRNISHLIYVDDTTLMAESEEELKSLLMRVKVESEKVGLKLNIQKMKIMASSPTTSWEIDGETMETVTDFILLGSKITIECDYSHEIKRCLVLGRKVMTNLGSILKSRDISVPTKVCLARLWLK